LSVAARVRVITHPRARLRRGGATSGALSTTASAPNASNGQRATRLVAVGASTGGPAALATILGALPRDFPVPIVVVLHLSKLFAPAMAEWLDEQCALPVRYAADGDALPPAGRGAILMAPPDRHLVLAGRSLRLSDAPERHSCRPSVDTLFESVAAELRDQVGACLLTGMGKDGAAGLLAARRAGGHTIAQDEASSVVFGMPREAILLGAAEQVLPVDAIAAAILRWTDKRREDLR
jgi:two-component system chemotaxis response regulator CheB